MKNARLTCHCGAVELAIAKADPISEAIRCDCSYCRRRGAAMLGARVEDVTVVKGADNLSVYQFNTNTAQHFFCKTCGIYTHHRRRIDDGQYGLNLGCIEGLDPRASDQAHWTDGVVHPLDRT